ncbi:MFS transporter [Rhodococcus opacus]|uniref:MFS transporter n=1 Tax=Rhodococcus opacus TaxID=37919 RepID=UPI00155B1453|nr:MFS transporter [Rhodococcus opacus]
MSQPNDTTREIRPAKVAFASAVGTSIEWYDFHIFNTAASLAFASVFFPAISDTAGMLAAFATFGVAFGARPIGGIVFGHFGDRIGRKKMLVLSLLLMGIGTFLVGVLPSHASIGIWAAVLLVLLRFVQGFAVGGEWGGAVLMASEYAPKEKRGFYASWPQAGAPLGLFLASAIYFLLTKTLTDAQFISWGWRIPFILSATLVMVGLYIRLTVLESPAFRAVQKSETVSRLPIVEVLRTHPKEILIGIGSTCGVNIPFYVAAVVGLSYAPEAAGVTRETVLLCMLTASFIEIFTIPYFSAISDRVGRRPVLMAGFGMGIIIAPAFFWLINWGSFAGVFLAYVLAMPILHGITYSAQASFLAELFETRLRYSGSSFAYQIGGMLTSGPAPFIAAALLAWTGSAGSISVYVIASVVISMVAVFFARESFRDETHQDRKSATLAGHPEQHATAD